MTNTTIEACKFGDLPLCMIQFPPQPGTHANRIERLAILAKIEVGKGFIRQIDATSAWCQQFPSEQLCSNDHIYFHDGKDVDKDQIERGKPYFDLVSRCEKNVNIINLITNYLQGCYHIYLLSNELAITII